MAEILRKAPTGIDGLDQLTGGGLPQGRATLVCGGPGCGKTLLATTFLVNGALEHDEPGVLISFDEPIDDMRVNNMSLGYDLADLRERKLLEMDHVHIDRNELEESGSFDLEGLFIRLDFAVRAVGARRVVLDTIDTLFAGVPNEAIVRSEFRRLLLWLKDNGLTTVITSERGANTLTRHGIEEYISDCVILLDHRVQEEISTRRLRVVKYRGSAHGSNEYPFLIGDHGLAVLPITSVGLEHVASSERISTGVDGLDELLEGKGYFKGSSILVSGGPGTGKTSIAAHFVAGACARGEKCLYYSFEESPRQLMRNMASIGLDFEGCIERDLLHCRSTRPTQHGLETHLAQLQHEIQEFEPAAVVVDPISSLIASGETAIAQTMALRLVDHLKSLGTTALFVSLLPHSDHLYTELNISSLMDTWIILKSEPELTGEQRRLRIVKSRGMKHSLLPQRLEITSEGLELSPLAKPG